MPTVYWEKTYTHNVFAQIRDIVLNIDWDDEKQAWTFDAYAPGKTLCHEIIYAVDTFVPQQSICDRAERWLHDYLESKSIR
jgi:hypothetical protein